ncbi:MAG: glycerophosphodiester phosphodiesterase [Ignavibacteriaceae bacterium]|nr:glycerophosphodiester phosphodiesterase [Ignavibacteriaceae bacterium]
MIFKNKSPEWLTRRPIAHRGLHNGEGIPENSLAAFQKAIENDYPIELDVQLLRDGTPVVFHDKNLSRLCGKDGLIRAQDSLSVKDYSLCDTSEKIPLLGEVLELVGGKVPILVELKNFSWPGEAEKRTAAMLNGYRGEFAVQSFNPFSVRWFRINEPSFCIGQLATAIDYHDVDKLRLFALRYLIVTLLSIPDFIGYDINCIPNLPTRIVKSLGVPLLAWTVRSREQYERGKRFCDNIIFEGLYPAPVIYDKN